MIKAAAIGVEHMGAGAEEAFAGLSSPVIGLPFGVPWLEVCDALEESLKSSNRAASASASRAARAAGSGGGT